MEVPFSVEMQSTVLWHQDEENLGERGAWMHVAKEKSWGLNNEVSTQVCDVCIDRLLMSMESFSEAISHQLCSHSTFFTAFDAAAVRSRIKE